MCTESTAESARRRRGYGAKGSASLRVTDASRGQKLSTNLVKELGFGILSSKRIWEYSKMSMKHLDDLVHFVQADPQHMELLQILRPQLERLVNNGSPDFREFLTGLKDGGLISEDEARELQVTFPLEDEALPTGKLNVDINQLVEGVKE
ncbi:hypothetical protein BDV12DRAFT_199176 [Aspergillus spectabilis]